MEITKTFYFKSSQIIIIKAKNKKGFQFVHLLVILLKVLNNVIREKKAQNYGRYGLVSIPDGIDEELPFN